MPLRFDRFAVAARIRSLLGVQDTDVGIRTAARLGVTEMALRMTMDERDPMPAMDVLVAVIAHYGVDPAWLVTGEYDARIHRMALEDDAAIASLILALSGDVAVASNGGAGVSAPLTIASRAAPLIDAREPHTA